MPILVGIHVWFAPRQGISSAQLYDMLPAIPRDTLMGVINEMLKHNRLDVFRPKPGVALFKEFPHGEGLKCALNNHQPLPASLPVTA